MNISYGLLGIRYTISEKRKEKRQKATLSDLKKVLEDEMEAFCDKKALEYGITRGTNLAKL